MNVKEAIAFVYDEKRGGIETWQVYCDVLRVLLAVDLGTLTRKEARELADARDELLYEMSLAAGAA